MGSRRRLGVGNHSIEGTERRALTVPVADVTDRLRVPHDELVNDA